MPPVVQAAVMVNVPVMHVMVPPAKQKDIIALPTFVSAGGQQVLPVPLANAEVQDADFAQAQLRDVYVMAAHVKHKDIIVPQAAVFLVGPVALLAAHQAAHRVLVATLYPTVIRELFTEAAAFHAEEEQQAVLTPNILEEEAVHKYPAERFPAIPSLAYLIAIRELFGALAAQPAEQVPKAAHIPHILEEEAAHKYPAAHRPVQIHPDAHIQFPEMLFTIQIITGSKMRLKVFIRVEM